MNANFLPPTLIKSGLKYLLCGLCVLIVLFTALGLSKINLSEPLQYSGDAVLVQSAVKGIIDNGWFLKNNYLGAPFSSDLYDFPLADNLHLFIIKIISAFTKNSATAINLFFILGFFLTAFSSLYVFQKFGFSYFISLLGALLYAFAPYHIMRHVGHLFLASYYIVPLSIMLILWVGKEEISFYPSVNKKGWLSILICGLTATADIYYAFFACFLLIVSTLYETLSLKEGKEKIKLVLTSAFLIFLIVFVIFINFIPNFVYAGINGSNFNIVKRLNIESEIYGMKISQLLTPVPYHEINFLKRISDLMSKYPLTNENKTAALGIAGSIGFLFLLLILFLKNKKIWGNRFDALHKLSILNLSGILLAEIGGFGSIFALVFPYIRSYNRMSIFISFFSIFALLCLLESARSKIKSKRIALIFYFMLAVILILGIVDQTKIIFDNKNTSSAYKRDSDYFANIESSLPPSSMVFQLPYSCYPECPLLGKTNFYDFLKPYLHSKNTKWSAAPIRNRSGDLFQKQISSKTTAQMLNILDKVGFSAILIDTYGYGDSGKAIISELKNQTKNEPIKSGDGRYYFFRI